MNVALKVAGIFFNKFPDGGAAADRYDHIIFQQLQGFIGNDLFMLLRIGL